MSGRCSTHLSQTSRIAVLTMAMSGISIVKTDHTWQHMKLLQWHGGTEKYPTRLCIPWRWIYFWNCIHQEQFKVGSDIINHQYGIAFRPWGHSWLRVCPLPSDGDEDQDKFPFFDCKIRGSAGPSSSSLDYSSSVFSWSGSYSVFKFFHFWHFLYNASLQSVSSCPPLLTSVMMKDLIKSLTQSQLSFCCHRM